MHRDYLARLIDGEQLWGFLEFLLEDGQYEKVPGKIEVLDDGHLVTEVILEELSPIGLDPHHKVSVNGKDLTPIVPPKVCLFDSVGGGITLIDIGEGYPDSHVWCQPRVQKYFPRFAIAARIEDPFWGAPKSLRIESRAFESWAHAGIVARSSEVLIVSREDHNTDEVVLKTWTPRPAEFEIKTPDWSCTLRLGENPKSHAEKELGQIMLSPQPLIEISCFENLNWRSALRVLARMHELIELLAWKSFGFGRMEGRFQQGTGNNSDGFAAYNLPVPPPRSAMSDWYPVFVGGVPREAGNRSGRSRFIIDFSNIGPSHIQKWADFFTALPAVVDNWVQIIRNPAMGRDVQMLQLGATIEHFGEYLINNCESHELQVRRGSNGNPFAVEYFKIVGRNALRLFPADFELWAEGANDCYQSAKHPDRKNRPDQGEYAKICDRTCLAIQICLASVLGASDDEIINYAGEDPRLHSSYVQRPDPASFLDDTR